MLSNTMSDAQVIFRLDSEMLQSLDSSIKENGFRTRNEWFRAEVRRFLDDMERKRALQRLSKLTVPGMSDDEAAALAMEWRKE